MSSFLYNPDLQSRDELLSNFVARQDVLERLVDDLRSGTPQHHLIVGQRGMGKTTLLKRLALEVERDSDLSSRWLALSFPEEQYNVARLSDLWLNCLDALADALEKGGHAGEAEALDTFIRGLPAQEESRAARALERLLAYARAKRGLVLCIDNVDQVLGRLQKDQWAIRKVLGAEERLVFVGASAAPFDAAFTYDQPFYDFFAVTWLKDLDVAEMRRVVLALAEREKDEAVVTHVGRHPERVKAMHVLTGGNPRTVVLLYQVLARDPDSDVRRQLESLLDQVTPLYKARVEALADQAQVVLDALATAWDPATAAEIAETTRMEVNTVSTQLSRLHDQGIVEKVDLPDSARQGFQVGERFFNVWYLMRASRRQRARLLSLAKCLEVLYGIEDLQALARQVLANPTEADFCLAVSKALRETGMQRALQAAAIDQVLGDSKSLRNFLALLGDEDSHLFQLAERKRAMALFRNALSSRPQHVNPDSWERTLLSAAVCWPRKPTEEELLTRAGQADSVGYLMGNQAWEVIKDAIFAGDLSTFLLEDCSEIEARAVAILYHAPWIPIVQTIRVHQGSPLPETVFQPGRNEIEVPVLSALLDHEIRREDGNWARTIRLAKLAATRVREHPIFAVAAWWVAQNEQDFNQAALVESVVETSDGEAWGRAAWTLAVAASEVAPSSSIRFWRRVMKNDDPINDINDFMRMLRGCVQGGCIAEALSLFEEHDLKDRARPLYAAVSAIAAGDPRHLKKFAPEVAGPGKELLDVLWPEEERPAPKAPPRKKRAR